MKIRRWLARFSWWRTKEEPEAEVVRLLQEHLDDALAGQVRGIGIVSLEADGNAANAWAVADERDVGMLHLALGQFQRRLGRAASQTFGD